MDFEIVEYNPEYEEELIDLFYRSVFYKKKEFEYVRAPNRWLFRYKLSDDYIIKLARVNGKIIASIGLLIRRGLVDEKKVKIGCFVDNCLLPEYLEKYTDIFSGLFTDLENACKPKDVSVIQGWDFLKNFKKHQKLWKTLNYEWKEGINWYPGGFDYKGRYPVEWKNDITLMWKTFFKVITLYHKFKEKTLSKLPNGISIKVMEETDLDSVYELFNKTYTTEQIEFVPKLSISEFRKTIKKNNIHGLVAADEKKIVGALTFITSAWSGWMYGKPVYSDKWQVFYTFTPDEFSVLPEYKNTSVPSHIALRLLKLISPDTTNLRKKSYGFIADVFDREIEWKRKAYMKVGCFEPKADFGVILSKSLKNEIKIDKKKIWSLPARYILAPVPSKEYSNEF
ncbi:MAG: hypothetical protein ACXACY_22200 [Candidatus Hodarchaeales archaeon]